MKTTEKQSRNLFLYFLVPMVTSLGSNKVKERAIKYGVISEAIKDIYYSILLLSGYYVQDRLKAFLSSIGQLNSVALTHLAYQSSNQDQL
jgi:hypothetical protein